MGVCRQMHTLEGGYDPRRHRQPRTDLFFAYLWCRLSTSLWCQLGYERVVGVNRYYEPTVNYLGTDGNTQKSGSMRSFADFRYSQCCYFRQARPGTMGETRPGPVVT